MGDIGFRGADRVISSHSQALPLISSPSPSPQVHQTRFILGETEKEGWETARGRKYNSGGFRLSVSDWENQKKPYGGEKITSGRRLGISPYQVGKEQKFYDLSSPPHPLRYFHNSNFPRNEFFSRFSASFPHGRFLSFVRVFYLLAIIYFHKITPNSVFPKDWITLK